LIPDKSSFWGRPPVARNPDGKYLSFNLARKSYGVVVLKVREIIRQQEIIPLPKAPHFIKGIIHLRGKIIPVIDLSLRFGMAPIEQDEHTCIIMVQIRKSNGEEKFVGLLVEAVQEVVQIGADDIEPAPACSVNWKYPMCVVNMNRKFSRLDRMSAHRTKCFLVSGKPKLVKRIASSKKHANLRACLSHQ